MSSVSTQSVQADAKHGVTALSTRERVFRGVLALLLLVVVYRLGFSGPASNLVEPIGALVLMLAAAATAIVGKSTGLLGIHQPYALGYLTARLFVGWEFLHAGWEKLTGEGWVGSGAGDAVSGFLHNATSPAMTSGEYPAVPAWFADLMTNVFLPNAHLMSYLIVFGEIAVGLGLIIGLFTRTAALGAILMSAAFLFAGSTGGGKNPEMLIVEMLLITGAAASIYTFSADYVIAGVKARRHSPEAVEDAKADGAEVMPEQTSDMS